MDDLRWQTRQKLQEVWHGQTEQVVVGSRVHVLVTCYDDARAHVPHNPAHENDDVENGYRDHNP